MWFATDRGLSVFDGYEFKNYSTNSGLISNTNFNFIENFEGKVFIIPYSGEGLNYLSNGKFFNFEHNEKLKSLTNGGWISNWSFKNNKLVFSVKENQKEFFLSLIHI